MYTQVATQLVVTTTAAVFSQAVSMEGANAVQVSLTAFNLNSATITVQLQESNDLQNWADVSGASFTVSSAYYGTNKTTGIASAYVRLKYTIATGGPAVLSAGINTALL